MIPMKNAMIALRNAKAYDDLQPVLDQLSRAARRLASAEQASAGTMQTLHDVLIEAQLQLDKLTHHEVRSRGASKQAAARHLELAGTIRELGRLLARTHHRRTASLHGPLGQADRGEPTRQLSPLGTKQPDV